MGLLDKTNKRQRFPVTLEDRTIFVRAIKKRELDRVLALEDKMQNLFIIGMSLVTESGVLEIPQNDGEGDLEFAKRVEDALDSADVDLVVQRQIIDACQKVLKYDPEAIAKNLPTTAKSGSQEG